MHFKLPTLSICLISSASMAIASVFPDMISVPSGTSPGSAVAVAEFQIGKWEVTWGKWKTVRDWAATRGYDLAGVGLGSGDEHPVHTINWYDAVKWLNAASEHDGLTPVYRTGGKVYRTGQAVPVVDANADGYRLPTEVEWEWAARGGAKSRGFTYSGSNVLDEVGWYAENSSGAEVDISDGNNRGTWPTGSKKGNELEIFDMSGNVSEWCWDLYGSARRTRGGNWWDDPANCSVAFSSFSDPASRHRSTGFRPARKRLLKFDEIKYPVTRDWLEIKVPEALANPNPDAKRVINVVIVNYILSTDGTNVKDGLLDHIRWGYEGKIQLLDIKKFFFNQNIKAKYSIEEGSKFRGFKYEDAKPYFGVNVVKCVTFYKDFQSPQTGMSDFNILFEKIGLKDLVEKNGVEEVWFNTCGGGFPHESYMSSPTARIDNSGRRRLQPTIPDSSDIMPTYGKTYVAYHFNPHSTFAEMLHCRAHQIEYQMEYLDRKFFWMEFVGNARPHPPLPWLPPGMKQGVDSNSTEEDWRTEFLGWRLSETGQITTDEEYSDFLIKINYGLWINGTQMNPNFFQWKAADFKHTGCGCCHFPPNGNKDYAYDRTEYVMSTIMNWSPDSTEVTPVNRDLWDIELVIPDNELPKPTQLMHWRNASGNTTVDTYPSNPGHAGWLTTWFQTIPSHKPIIFHRSGPNASQVENWWDIIFDWDEAIKSGKKLYRNGLLQTINPFPRISNKPAGAAPFSVSIPSATSGLPVELSVKSGPARISGNNTINLTGPGTVILAANQKGDATHLSAEEVTTSFIVTPPKPAITSALTANATVGTTFSYQITASNNPTRFAASGLPAGLSINATTGRIGGRPTVVGNANVTLTAINAGGNGTARLVLRVLPQKPTITSALTANATVGTTFSYQITASNNPTRFAATGLPAGLSINATTGRIGGRPTVLGNANVTLTAINAGGNGTARLVLRVLPQKPAITSALTANATVGTTFSYQITASNNPTRFAATGLPAGLSINATTGRIGGRPTAVGNSTVNISATNPGGNGTANLRLRVFPRR